MLQIYETQLRDEYGICLSNKLLKDFEHPIYWNACVEFSPLGSDVAHDSFFKYLDLPNSTSDIRKTVEVLKHMSLESSVLQYTKTSVEDMNEFLAEPRNQFNAINIDRSVIACCFAQIIQNETVGPGMVYEVSRAIVRQTHPEWRDTFATPDQIKAKATFFSQFVSAIRNYIVEE